MVEPRHDVSEPTILRRIRTGFWAFRNLPETPALHRSQGVPCATMRACASPHNRLCLLRYEAHARGVPHAVRVHDPGRGYSSRPPIAGRRRKVFALRRNELSIRVGSVLPRSRYVTEPRTPGTRPAAPVRARRRRHPVSHRSSRSCVSQALKGAVASTRPEGLRGRRCALPPA